MVAATGAGMSAAKAQLMLRADRTKVAPLDPGQPLTIGRAAGNRLCLAQDSGVADHHAVVRFSKNHGWLICDWQSSGATFLEGQPVRQCRPLSDGDEIQLGRRGPVLVFQLLASPASTPAPTLDFEGQSLPIAQIRSASVRSQPLHPHIFSWWLLICLAGLLLLPFPGLFWPLEAGALAGWLVLGSRKRHTLMVELRDGQAVRHDFANRLTALAHRNGIRKAMGQGSAPP